MNGSDLYLRIHQLMERIATAALRAGRQLEDITVLAATKTVSSQLIQQAIELGLRHFGENRVQEAEAKLKHIPLALRQASTWHLIGHLQSNKARRAISLFDVIQTIDSPRLAHQLNRLAAEAKRILPIYIEVKTDPSPTKSGISPDALFDLARSVARCHYLRLEGLMTVPPFFDHAEDVRPYFQQLRRLRDQLNQQRLVDYPVNGLSMGMSHDYEIAIEEGATLVRLGTAIWGPRPVRGVIE